MLMVDFKSINNSVWATKVTRPSAHAHPKCCTGLFKPHAELT